MAKKKSRKYEARMRQRKEANAYLLHENCSGYYD